MTVTARHARRQIEATCTLLGNLTPRIVQGIHNAQVAIDGGGDNPQREDAGIRSKGAVSDPTAQQALGRLATRERVLDDIETALETLRITTALMVSWVELHAPIPTMSERCSGGRTVDEWSRPDCQNWAAEYERPDGTRARRSDGLCDACRMAKHRWERDKGRGAA